MITADNLVSLCQTYVNSISNRVEPADWYTFITSAIREVRRGRTFPTQRRSQTLDVFSSVFVYPTPIDFDSFIKPHDRQFNGQDQGQFMLYGRDKDFYANNSYGLAITQNANDKYLMVRRDGAANLVVDTFEDDGAIYTAYGDSNNIIFNKYDFIEGNQAIQFNVTNALGYAGISHVLPEATDITNYVDLNGSVFVYVKVPQLVTSVTINLASSVGNYYTFTPATTDFLGKTLTAGWHLVKLSFNNVTAIGSPDKTAINSYDIIINHGGITDIGFEIDAFFLRQPVRIELPYNSKYIVTDANGTYQEAVLAGSDIILIEEDYIELLAYKAVEHAANWKFGDPDVMAQAATEYNKAVVEFSRRYPSVEASVQSNYYRPNGAQTSKKRW